MVITDTATIIGEINGSSTLSETPSPAMMKANSPICARLNPDLIEVFRGSPDKSTPNEEKMALPRMVTRVMMITGQAYSTNTAGFTSIPTETKKIAPKRSFTGCMICSMCSASMVSARIDPMINAPSAVENPV